MYIGLFVLSSASKLFFIKLISEKVFIMGTKVHLVKAMVFPVVMYGCESWTVKKAEH